jgi:hypothetical protein
MTPGGLRLLLLSGLTGAAIQRYFDYVTGFPGYVWRRLRSRPALDGTWYSYHYSRQHSRPLLKTVAWVIRRDFRGHYLAKCQYDDSPALRGAGSVSRERGFLVLHVSATTYEAEWTIRILDPLPTNERVVPGLWLSYDFDGELIAGPMIFGRERMSEAQAEDVLRSRTSVSPTCRLLGVRRALTRSTVGTTGPIAAGSQP